MPGCPMFDDSHAIFILRHTMPGHITPRYATSRHAHHVTWCHITMTTLRLIVGAKYDNLLTSL